MSHYRHFKHLHIPDHWEQYWSRYPNGYTLLEALISWTTQVNNMVDSQNHVSDQMTALKIDYNALEKELRMSWNAYKEHTVKTYEDFQAEILVIVNNWIASIEPTIQDETVKNLNNWLSDGTLADIINNDVFDMKANQTDLDNVSAELAQTNSAFELSKKATNDFMKQLAQSVSQSSQVIDFSRTNLDSWVHTEGVEIVEGNLTITDDTQTNAHANVALFKGVPNARSIEIELTGGFTARARVAFGKDEKNFFYGTFSANLPDVDFYRVENGELVSSSLLKATNERYLPEVGDRLRFTIHNQNIQIFVNDNLWGTLILTDEYKHLVDGPVMAGVGFRDAGSQRFEVSRVSISPERRYKYIHFSIDDVVAVFEDLTTNSGTYSSIFDNDTLKWLKNMHDRFGTVVSLYLFYQNENNTWNLSQMPTKYRSEFRKNADWLKLGFHGLDTNAKYDLSSYNSQQSLTHYNNMISQIKRFAHELNIDVVPRTAFFTGHIDIVKEWKNAPNGVKGFISSDDDRANMMYLDAIQRQTLKYCDDFYDANEDLYFVRTDLRLEHHTDPVSELESRIDDYTLNGQHDVLEVFTHEGPLSGTTNKVKAEAIFEWGLNSGYVFDFPMNNIMKS